MKFQTAAILLAFVATSLAVPTAQDKPEPKGVVEISKRSSTLSWCRGDCSVSNAGKCEARYAGDAGGAYFTKMSSSGCGWLQNRCCCAVEIIYV
ncbi:hypothetical protein HDV00_005494 [Rhizophlyctis rosea]|nr:hypothetical protein HDV00_005494 [Rhizophlyctis rosea]